TSASARSPRAPSGAARGQENHYVASGYPVAQGFSDVTSGSTLVISSNRHCRRVSLSFLAADHGALSARFADSVTMWRLVNMIEETDFIPIREAINRSARDKSTLRARIVSVLAGAAAMLPFMADALPVIPNAAGFGVDTPTGRGGKVYK